jgi:hypothetical protein
LAAAEYIHAQYAERLSLSDVARMRAGDILEFLDPFELTVEGTIVVERGTISHLDCPERTRGGAAR